MSKLERAQEFLSEIEEYLRNTLANEKLSPSAQIKRRHLLDKFYALGLQANVEHKPGSTSSLQTGSRQKGTSQNAPDCCKKDGKSCSHKNSEDAGEDLYEEPVACDSDHEATSNGKGSDTEYESYDEEDDDEEDAFYVNNGSEQIGREQIHLPRSKKQVNDGSAISSESVRFTGELYKKGLLSWTKCYCVLTDLALVCYRAGKESKVLVKILLSGYETNFLEKDGRYYNLIRISRLGSEHWFYADSKDTAEKWITHLAAVGCKEHAESAEKAILPAASATKSDSMDSVLTNATSTEGQTNLSSGSSEGSGDGVIQANASSTSVASSANTLQTVDKRKKSKLGESLQTLLGTFGKKKGDKLKRALNEACALDPDTHAAGYVNICSELAEDSKWVKRFCVVKNNRLDCYKDPLDEYIEFSLALIGAQIELIDKSSPKKIKIVQDVKEVLLSAFVDADSGRWLGILLRESGFGAQLVASDRTSASEADASNMEGIYDEVYNWEVYDIGDRQNASAPPPPPPPPPRLPPPKVPPQQQQQPTRLLEEQENEYIEPNDIYDHMFDDDLLPDESLGLEEALNSAFFNIREGLNRKEGSPSKEQTNRRPETAGAQAGAAPDRSASHSPASKHKDLCPRRAFPVGIPTADGDDNDGSTGVVKCHIGPTIAEDKALLETTQNPILTELRKEKQMKGSGKADKPKLEEKIADLRREYEDIKKKRSSIRRSLQTIESSLEKAHLENEIVKLDKKLEMTDKEVAKLSMLAQEIDGKSFFQSESLRSASAGRGIQAKRDAGVMSPTFIHVSRNSSLRETSSAVHRTTSSGSLDQKFNTISASSSPLQARKVAQLDKRASLSDTSPLSGSSVTRTVEIQTRTVVSTFRSAADGRGTGVLKSSSASAGARPATQHSLASRSYGDDTHKFQGGKLDAGGVAKAAMSTRPLSGCAPAKDRLANTLDPSGRSQCVKNRTVEALSSETRSASGNVVQEKLKLWESM